MEYFTMRNGRKIPMAGIGVFQFTPKEAEDSVRSALISGVRLIDTANGYMNERGVGRGMKESGVPREEVFLVSKLWPTVYEDEDAVDKTLARLDTEYVDLMFLHQPAGNWKAGYRQLEKAYNDGKIRAIGLSNFQMEDIQWIMENADVKPHMLQVEAHPYFQRRELRDFLEKNQIGLMAWYPLGHGDKSLTAEPIFKELGEKYGKSSAQIILRWHTQVGHVVFPGSRNPAHIRDNFDIFDFTLTKDELKRIESLDKNQRYYIPDPKTVAKYAEMKLDFDAQE